MSATSAVIKIGMLSSFLLSWNVVPKNVDIVDYCLVQISPEQRLNVASTERAVEESLSSLSNKLIEWGEIKKKYLNRLSNLSQLEYNWDGNGAQPLSPGVIEVMISVIENTSTQVLNFWRLFPDLNGSLIMSAKNKFIMGINVGEKEFSYAARYGGKRDVGKLPTNCENIIRILTEFKEMVI